LKFTTELQAVYLRGTTYLQTTLFGMIPVVTLFVLCAGAVVYTTRNDLQRSLKVNDILETVYQRLQSRLLHRYTYFQK